MLRPSSLLSRCVSAAVVAASALSLQACGSRQHVATEPLAGESIVDVAVRLDQTVIADTDRDSVALIDVTATT